MSVTHLSEVDERASTWTTEDLLESELKKVKSGERVGDCICLYLDTSDGQYAISYGCSGFNKMTQIIALLECLKVQIISEDMELI